MSVYDWEDVGGDMADNEAILEEASEICEERDGNCFGCPIARECPFQTTKGTDDDYQSELHEIYVPDGD